jgi:hypothetical protein
MSPSFGGRLRTQRCDPDCSLKIRYIRWNRGGPGVQACVRERDPFVDLKVDAVNGFHTTTGGLDGGPHDRARRAQIVSAGVATYAPSVSRVYAILVQYSCACG